MPEIGPFTDNIAAHDVSDIIPATLSRYSPAGIDRGRPLPGIWIEGPLAGPYVVLPVKATERTRRVQGARADGALGLILAHRIRVAGDVALGKPDRLLCQGRWWIAAECVDWIDQSGYFAATFALADEPEGQP